ncbi:hypothetical protein PAXINDRAFT_167485, partial [Paxillus involutus ATCC 200175]
MASNTGLPPLASKMDVEVITTLDPENYCCAWKNVDSSGWLLDVERWQALVEVVEDGRKTRHDTVEVFHSLLAHPIRFL